MGSPGLFCDLMVADPSEQSQQGAHMGCLPGAVFLYPASTDFDRMRLPGTR